MKRKKRSSKEKLMIVLEGLKGIVPLAELLDYLTPVQYEQKHLTQNKPNYSQTFA